MKKIISHLVMGALLLLAMAMLCSCDPGTDSGSPIEISQIAAALDHMVVLDTEGRVWTMGNNSFGELGYITQMPLLVLTEIHSTNSGTDLPAIKEVKADYGYTIFLDEHGSVWSIGRNIFGQLGDGTNTDRHMVVPMLNTDGTDQISGITQIAAGETHMVLLDAEKKVWAVGYNKQYQLGDGTVEGKNTIVPMLSADGLSQISGITQIAAGATHTVLLDTEKKVWSVGSNQSGQLGDGTNTDKHRVVPMLNADGTDQISGITQIVAGKFSTFLLDEQGNVWAVGKNHLGQLGNGQSGDDEMEDLPVEILTAADGTTLPTITAIATGHSHTILLDAQGKVWAMGMNTFGQLGDGTLLDRTRPVPMLNGKNEQLSGIVQIAAGDYYTLLLDEDGNLWAVGTLSWLGVDNQKSPRPISRPRVSNE